MPIVVDSYFNGIFLASAMSILTEEIRKLRGSSFFCAKVPIPCPDYSPHLTVKIKPPETNGQIQFSTFEKTCAPKSGDKESEIREGSRLNSFI